MRKPNATLQRNGFLFLAATLALLLCAVDAHTQPPQSGGELGQCVNGQDYGIPAKCKILASSCSVAPMGMCMAGSGDCYDPADTNDPPATVTCTALLIDEVIDIGYCDSIMAGTEKSDEKCTRCDYVACASGTYYLDDFDCASEINPMSEGFYYASPGCVEEEEEEK